MRFRHASILVLILFLVPTSTATMVEFNQGQHNGRSEFSGDLSAAVLFAEGPEWPFNAIHARADVLVVREATTEHYIDMEGGPSHSRAPEHNEVTLHNARVQATPREDATYVAFHSMDSAAVTYRSDSASSSPPSDDSFEDINWIQMQQPRTSDVSESLDVATKGHVDAEIVGCVSMNLWGWNVRITSDEGTFEYQTGPSQDTQAGTVSVGPATQLQVESSNATVTFTGTFPDVHHVWIRDAVAESDRMDLKLMDEDLPTDQVVFDERRRLAVLGVTDTVTANVTEIRSSSPVSPTKPNTGPDPSDREQDSDGEPLIDLDTSGGQNLESLAPQVVVKVPWLAVTGSMFLLAVAIILTWFWVHPLALYEHLRRAGGQRVTRIRPVTNNERRAIAWSWKARQHVETCPRLAALEAGIAARLDPSRPVYRLRHAKIHSLLGHPKRVLRITDNLWMHLSPRRSKAEVHCLRARARLALGHAEIAHREMRAADSLDAFTTHDALARWRTDGRFKQHAWIHAMYDDLHRLVHHNPF